MRWYVNIGEIIFTADKPLVTDDISSSGIYDWNNQRVPCDPDQDQRLEEGLMNNQEMPLDR